jgi:hypothetical protein
MIQGLVLVMIIVVVLGEFLVTSLGLPRVFKLAPELLSLVATFTVVFAGVGSRFRFVSPKYWLAFAFIVIVMLSGILLNHVGTGPTIAGMRMYLRAIPFFFIPAVYIFSDAQVKQQLKLLFMLALVQIPVAAYQRWIVHSEGRWSGDEVAGTLQISSILSVFLICGVMILVGLRLRDRLNRVAFLVACLLLLVPTTINETKGTLILLPIGLFVALFVGSPQGKRLRVAALAVGLLAGFGALFVPVYDYFMKNAQWETSIVDFFTEEEKLEKYLEKEGAGVGAVEATSVGRADAVRISIDYVSREPARLAFGLGLGSISDSSLGDGFSGPYHQLFQHVAKMSFSVFVLEIGLLGVATVFLLYWLLFWDTVFVARNDHELKGSIAIGWAGVVAVIAFATFYKTIHTFESLSYLFWYFSGLVAARRIQLASDIEVRPVVQVSERKSMSYRIAE